MAEDILEGRPVSPYGLVVYLKCGEPVELSGVFHWRLTAGTDGTGSLDVRAETGSLIVRSSEIAALHFSDHPDGLLEQVALGFEHRRVTGP